MGVGGSVEWKPLKLRVESLERSQRVSKRRRRW